MSEIEHIKRLLKAILDNMTEQIVLVDTDHRILCFNRVLEEHYSHNFRKEILEGADYRDLVNPDNLSLYLASFERAVHGEVIDTEAETFFDSRPTWFRYKMNPVYDESKRLLGVALTGTNIDVQKRREIALEESYKVIATKTAELAASESYYRTLIETSSDAIVLLDEYGHVIYQTASTDKISGYTLEEIQQIDGIELIHPDDREKDNLGFHQMLAQPGAVLHRKHRLKHKNGNYIVIEGAYRNLLHEVNVRAIVFTYTDVTEREQAIHNLTERIKEISTIYEVNNILQDEEQSVEEVFSKIVKILPDGWQFPDICAAKIAFDEKEYVTPNYCQSTFSQTAPFSIEDGRAGSIEVVYLKETPAFDEGPFLREERALIETLATTIQVYFNKRVNERQKERMIADLLQRNADLEQFAQIVSHNVRGPLSTILGLCSLSDEQMNEDDVNVMVEGINSSALRLDAVVKDLNEILQVRREVHETKTMVSLDEILTEVRNSISVLIEEKSARIDCDFSAARELLTVRSYISCIFYDLFTNSLKYSSPATVPRIVVRSETQGDKTMIHVSDNGIGIDLNKYKNRVFGLYQRFNFSVEGKGLGLFMTRTRVESLNGKIVLQSEPGLGTSVTMVFPN